MFDWVLHALLRSDVIKTEEANFLAWINTFFRLARNF